MRTPAREPSGRAWIIASTALILLLGIASVPSTRHWVQTRLGSNRPLVATFKPLGVGPGVHLAAPIPNDAWARFLPSPKDCPGSTTPPPPEAMAENSMICVLNYARLRQGLRALPVAPQLQQAARLKALDIIRCQDFSHSACGKDPRAVADAVAYPKVTWGENIYAGGGPFMPARVAADGWLNSPHHRENLFRPGWTEQGIAVVVAKRFKGESDVAIWVSEFGERR
jgi:uncharacterized protein YkwD